MPCPHGNTHASASEAELNGWKKGPFPDNTYKWGAVVPFDECGKPATGFYFADFYGDFVMAAQGIEGTKDLKWVKMLPHEVAFYNNCIGLAPVTEEE